MKWTYSPPGCGHHAQCAPVHMGRKLSKQDHKASGGNRSGTPGQAITQPILLIWDHCQLIRFSVSAENINLSSPFSLCAVRRPVLHFFQLSLSIG